MTTPGSVANEAEREPPGCGLGLNVDVMVCRAEWYYHVGAYQVNLDVCSIIILRNYGCHQSECMLSALRHVPKPSITVLKELKTDSSHAYTVAMLRQSPVLHTPCVQNYIAHVLQL